MKKYIFFLLLALLWNLRCYCQPQVPSTQPPLITPPSPEAAALGKYGQTPVSLSTGVPNISVPLYQIKTSRFNLPISLSYHASGVKVDEHASWVGQNWVLNAGGLITRSIIGIGDQSTNGFLNINLSQTYQDLNTDGQLNYDIINGQKDTEPDYFFYNFADYSGKFIYGDDHNPILIPIKKIKVAFDQLNNRFTIIDEQGNTYKFADVESVTSEIPGFLGSATTTSPSSWYLSEMVSADKSDTIKFSYNRTNTSLYENSYSYNASMGNLPYQQEIGSCIIQTAYPQSSDAILSNRVYQPLSLNEISYKGGKIAFVANTARLDETNNALDSIVIYKYNYNTKTYSKLRSLSLNTSYFYSPLNNQYHSTITSKKYRLKLDAVKEYDGVGAFVKQHTFDYNMQIPPPVNNFAQDIWGFYNGKSSNIDLLQRRTVNYFGAVYNIGNADRNFDADYIQAGMLTKIHFPTGGYTEYTYEPHKYLIDASQSTRAEIISVTAVPDMTPVNSTNVTMTAGGGNAATLRIEIPKYSGLTPIVTVAPIVKLIRVSTGQVLFQSSGNPQQNTDYTIAISDLIANETYQLYAAASGNSNVFASITLNYSHLVATPDIRTGGGLRIKEIKDFDSNQSVSNVAVYKYGKNEDGVGTLVSAPQSVTKESVEKVFASYGLYSSDPCRSTRRVYSSSSIYQLGQLNGVPVWYDAVTKYEGNETANSGKTVYEYSIAQDQVLPVSSLYNDGFMYLDNSGFRNDQPVRESFYSYINNQYRLIKETITKFLPYGGTSGQAIKVFYAWQPSGNVTPVNDLRMYGHFYYPLNTGLVYADSVIERQFATTGSNVLEKKTKLFYDNLSHFRPTRISSMDSQGKIFLEKFNYPSDMVVENLDPNGVYAAMVTANIISPLIQYTKSSNGSFLQNIKTNYANFSDVYKPESIEVKNGSNPSETRLNYIYDNKGNLISHNQSSGSTTSYIWGYNKAYPIAQVFNANVSNIFFESFEEGTGSSVLGDSKTGYYSKTSGFSKGLTGLMNGRYTLSYWKKSGAIWELVILNNISVTSGTYPISLTNTLQVDDIRFYPSDAQMTTYTYDPLVGMTSVTDAKNQATYYEYDSFQRLLNVKDQNKNILKNYQYNYAHESFWNDEQFGYFSKACTVGTGTSVKYTVPAHTYSAESVSAANALAQADVAANGQANANAAPGATCQVLPYAVIEQTSVTTNGDAQGYANYRIKLFTDNTYTTAYTATSGMAINFRVQTSTTVNNGVPTVINNNYTATVSTGSSISNLGQYENGCGVGGVSIVAPGTPEQSAVTAGTTAKGGAETNVVPPGGNTTCVTKSLNVLSGTGYLVPGA